MKTEEQFKEDVYAVHKEVVYLCKKLDSVLYEYLIQKESQLTQREKFLVVSRAVNAHATHWCRHFHSEFNPEKFLMRIEDKLNKDERLLDAALDK